MTVIEEYTKEQILDFTWINQNQDYILTDYYWQKFRKSINPEFTTKKGSRKRYYSERVYTQFCLWLIDLDISRTRSPRRKVMEDIKEKLNEQKDELLSIGCAQDVFNAAVERSDSVDAALTQVQRYVDLVTGGGIEKAREEAEKEREFKKEIERVELRKNLDDEIRKIDSLVNDGLLSKEDATQLKRRTVFEAYIGIPEAQQKAIEDATEEMRRLAETAKYDRKLAVEYSNGHMSRPTLYVKVDYKDIYNKMPNYKIGYTTDMQRREEISTSDNGHLKLVLAREFETVDEVQKAEREIHEWLFKAKRRADQVNPKEWLNNHCKEFFYLNKPMFRELKHRFEWKEYLSIKKIYELLPKKNEEYE